MKHPLIALPLSCLLLAIHSPDRAAAVQQADDGPEEHEIYRLPDIEWEDGPDSLEEGARFAVLEGDPGKEAFFNMRLKFPDGFVINPHSHPAVERLTVISGVFRLGSGEEIEWDEATALEAGSYTSMPPGMNHFARAEGETVVQIATVGPWEVEYVNPEDDPRNGDD